MNDWNAIRAFYREADPEIMAAGSWEWGIDSYLWQNGMLSLTPIEQWLWHDIRAAGAVLYPQYPVGRFFVDFGNPVAKVAVECDGAAYHQDADKDARRDAELRRMGWSVYRITGRVCRTDADPETGESGEAMRLMRRICEDHGIGRGSRPQQRSEVDVVTGESLWHLMQREAAILAAAKAAGRSA